MDLRIEPIIKTDDYTISDFLVGDKWFSYCLEDTDRGLSSDMSLSNIQALKVFGKTAIPSGRYEVMLTPSVRFKRDLPILMDVPGFSGVRIHAGSYNVHTEGCLLLGTSLIPHGIGNSRPTVDKFVKLLKAGITQGIVHINVNR